jgi:four helix bundle protein
MSNSFKDLLAWQQGMDLVELTYEAIAKLPKDERFDLASQMRRAVVSVVSNIAEGQGRNGKGEFIHFLGIAKASLTELETHVYVAERVKYFGKSDVARLVEQIDRVARLLNGLINSMKRSAAAGD